MLSPIYSLPLIIDGFSLKKLFAFKGGQVQGSREN